MANIPLTPLNRIRGSVSVPSNTNLNLNANQLGEKGITLKLEGKITDVIPAMTGVVNSPRIYQTATITLDLLKTNGFGDIWKKQAELNSLIGDIVVYPDTSALSNYPLSNCSIADIDPDTLNGTSASMSLTITGTYYINSSLSNLI